jgi:riboflavin biosynthesis pyrimidine reductase
MNSISSLYDCGAKLAECVLPEDLRRQYGGDLCFPAAPASRPYVVANFVSTLDGVISFNIPDAAGGVQISGSNDGDRFIMGLLRASADAVLVGAGTVRAVSPKHVWIAEFVYPAAKDAYARYRHEILRKPQHPLIVIVSGGGHLDLDRSVFHTSGVSVVILTTARGRDRLLRDGAAALRSTQIRELRAADEKIEACTILKILRTELGVRLLLHEAGPTLFGQFLSAGVVDELFLTMAPQIAGRVLENSRPGLVASVQFLPDTAPWLTLLSTKQQASHLYLRYRRHASREPQNHTWQNAEFLTPAMEPRNTT